MHNFCEGKEKIEDIGSTFKTNVSLRRDGATLAIFWRTRLVSPEGFGVIYLRSGFPRSITARFGTRRKPSTSVESGVGDRLQVTSEKRCVTVHFTAARAFTGITNPSGLGNKCVRPPRLRAVIFHCAVSRI